MSFPKYEAYKDSGVEWLGEVPEHWSVEALKYHAQVFPSNVDKKAYEGQAHIRLCNYTDVYYNDQIIEGMDFMPATATEEQIDRFSLRAGDVIFTKDSETSDDIAIASYVPRDLPGVICGYHLSMVRPDKTSDGAFIKRFFDSCSAKAYFEISANGLTRVGLSQYATDNVPIPIPPLSEQAQIARFLDHETARIDALIAEQQRLIELLKEKRQAVISHAVTKGLDPTAPMKGSGVEWLGEMPAHWEITPIKNLCYVNDGNHGEEYPKDSDSATKEDGVPFIRAGDFENFKIIEDDLRYISREKNDSMRKGNLQENDILFVNRGATIGKIGFIDKSYVGANLNSQIAYLRVDKLSLSHRYLLYFLSSNFIQETVVAAIMGGALPQYPIKNILNLDVCHPNLQEQLAVAAYLDSATETLDSLEVEAERAIELLKERRSALISAAVTGKIDVRGWQAPASAAPAPTRDPVHS
jgi:type I restriction enzyme S subunit